MTYLDSLILGIIEGFTEFLPVSSTGHLILASDLLGIVQTPEVKSFEIAIQLGAILAVLVVYWRSFLDTEILKRVALAFVPTAIVGFALYKIVKGYLIGNEAVVIVALFVGGVLIIAIEHLVRDREANAGSVKDVSLKQAFYIGLFQSLAVIPGVSRSGATVMGGLLMNIPRAAILEFSFLLAVPTIAAAVAYDLYKTPEALSGASLGFIVVGSLMAFVVALVVVKFALSFVKRWSFAPFGWYRIALAAVFVTFFL